MAPNTRRQTLDKGKQIEQTRTLENAIISTDNTQTEGGLNGPVDRSTYMHLDKLAKCLGLGNKTALKEWMQSPTFKTPYDQLYNACIRQRQITQPGASGPKLVVVQRALEVGEAFGEARYSELDVDKSNWEEVDHYAYCLLRLRELNMRRAAGIFWQKRMSIAEVDERLNQAIMRETKDRASTLKRSLKIADMPLPLLMDAPRGDSVLVGSSSRQVLGMASPAPTSSSNTRPNTPQKHQLSPKSTPSSKRKSLERPSSFSSMMNTAQQARQDNNNADVFMDDPTSSSSSQNNRQLTLTKPPVLPVLTQGPPSPTRSMFMPRPENERMGDDVKPELKRTELHRDDAHDDVSSQAGNPNQGDVSGQAGNPNQGDVSGQAGNPNQGDVSGQADNPNQGDVSGQAGNSNQEHILDEEVIEQDLENDGSEAGGLSNWELMKQNEDPNNPFNLDTRIGRYNTIHAVLRYYAEPLQLFRLRQGPRMSQDDNAQELYDAEQIQWQKEVDSLGADDHTFKLDLDPASEDELLKMQNVEKMLDNPEYQPRNYLQACRELGIPDPERPQLPGMPPTLVLTPAQVCGAHRILQIYKDRKVNAAMLADGTGLGKTILVITVYYFLLLVRQNKIKRFEEQLNAHYDALAEHEAWAMDNPNRDADNPIHVPEHPDAIPPAKPFLLVVLADCIDQWAGELKRFSTRFNPLIYYGDSRPNVKTKTYTGKFEKVEGHLHKDHPLFANNEANSRVVIITSVTTLSARHGPAALAAWRKKTQAWSRAQCIANYDVIDTTWPGYLADKFVHATCDEAQVIKNYDTASNKTCEWLNIYFWILVSAYPLPNRIEDFGGYAKIILPKSNLWTEANFARWKVEKTVNPFSLPDNHPASRLRLTPQAVEKFITGPDRDQEKAGYFLRFIWRECMVRRTYQSPDPRNPTVRVGDAIPRVNVRRLVCRFNAEEFDEYFLHSDQSYRELATVLDDGSIVWNRRHARKLILNTTWTGFGFISDDFMSGSIAQWKNSPNLLHEIIKCLHRRMIQKGKTPFDLPAPDDVHEMLAIVMRGAPKLRVTLKMVADLVVLNDRKLIQWTSMPASQILLLAIYRALRIPAEAYTSELSRSERGQLLQRFNDSNHESRIFLGSYYVGSVGLNLQYACNHAQFFDAPPNRGAEVQAGGRTRRIGQTKTVEFFETYVENGFQNRQIQNNLLKAIPAMLTELSVAIFETPDDMAYENDKLKLDITAWYMLDGELVPGTDIRAKDIPPEKRLNPNDLASAISELLHGKKSPGEAPEPVVDDDWEQEQIDESVLKNIPIR